MKKEQLVNPILMWIIIIIVSLILFFSLPKKQLLENNTLKYLLVFSAIYFIYFFFNGMRVHKEAIRSAYRINYIVEEGVYSLVRHPMYSADIFLTWGLFFYFQSLRAFLIVFWITVFLIFWMRLEEKMLIEKFGDRYIRYKERVPMFVPNFKKR